MLLPLCFCALFYVVKMNVVKFTPRDILPQNILMSNPIIGFDLVCTSDVQKKENRLRKHHGVTDREKTFSNYSTRSPTSLNLSDWWLHGFFTPLNGFLCCQPFQRDLPHLPHNPLAFQKNTSTVETWYAPQNDFLFPTSAPWLPLADSWHHNSLCLCWKRLQRAREKLSPYFTIETCQWNNHRHWQVAREFFFSFFLLHSSIKQADVWKTLVLVSGHVYCCPLKLRSCPPSAFRGFF